MTCVFQEAPPLPDEDQRLVEAYERAGRSLDDLPYTPEFDRLYQSLAEQGESRDKRQIMRRLLNLRKAGRLPRLGRGGPGPSPLTLQEEELLMDMVPRYAGTVGQRDSLIYTDQFKQLVDEFNRQTGRDLNAHDIWRLVARIAK